MNYLRLLYLSIFLFNFSFGIKSVYSDEFSIDHSRVESRCKKNPTSVKCRKYFDAKYRRHTDAVKKKSEDLYDSMPGQKEYQNQLKKELRSFCKKEPDSRRCKKIRK